jgi:hypothetical protein
LRRQNIESFSQLLCLEFRLQISSWLAAINLTSLLSVSVCPSEYLTSLLSVSVCHQSISAQHCLRWSIQLIGQWEHESAMLVLGAAELADLDPNPPDRKNPHQTWLTGSDQTKEKGG